MNVVNIDRNTVFHQKRKDYTIKAFDVEDRYGYDYIGLSKEDMLHLVLVAYAGQGDMRADFSVEVRWIDKDGKDRDLDPNLVAGLLRPDETLSEVAPGPYISNALLRFFQPEGERTFFRYCKYGRGKSIKEDVLSSYAAEFVIWYGNLLQAVIHYRHYAHTVKDALHIALLVHKVNEFGYSMAHPQWQNSNIETASRNIEWLKTSISEMETRYGHWVQRYEDSTAVLERFGVPYVHWNNQEA